MMLPSPYYLLHLISEVGEVSGRKRLQKVVYLLQLEGLPTQKEFIFHYYGPYSQSLAEEMDALSQSDLLGEEPRTLGPPEVCEYRYAIKEPGRQIVRGFAENAAFRKEIEGLKPFVERFKRLVAEDVRILELASTIAYWLERGYPEEEAIKKTIRLKGGREAEKPFQKALQIARESFARSST